MVGAEVGSSSPAVGSEGLNPIFRSSALMCMCDRLRGNGNFLFDLVWEGADGGMWVANHCWAGKANGSNQLNDAMN